MHTLRMVMLAMMVAIGVVISPILRIEGMCPTAHLVNIVCSVLMGPWYSLLCATMIGVIREIFGTGIIGSMVSYPVMAFLMGRGGLTAFYYTPMFLAATTMGGCVAYIFLKALSKAGLLVKFQAALGSKTYETKNFTTAKAN